MMKTNQAPSALEAVPEPLPPRTGAIAESGENYLETILVLKERRDGGLVRAVDIANELRLSKASVSRGLGLLREKGLIHIADSGDLEFTPAGQKLAQNIFHTHQVLTVLFQEIAKVPLDVAERDACRIEHVISDETLQGIIRFYMSAILASKSIPKSTFKAAVAALLILSVPYVQESRRL